ncbi:MAG: hypothetical protein K0S61_2303 [Anaerocolumna sp.]|jgi:hypothetical protein|nr:hypothetical protein [Anaerocolumna sp.]
MTKAKLCGFAIISAIGIAGLGSITTVTAETKTESVTLTENKKDHNSKKAEFEKKMKAAEEKWNTLTQAQKDEVYVLLMAEMDNESKVLEKLAELGVLEKSDVDIMKAFKLEMYNRLKESGEFPFSRGKGRK